MLKILLPVDGSVHGERAARAALQLAARAGGAELHLLAVQIPIDSGHARMFVSAEEVEAWHREQGEAELAPAAAVLAAAGQACTRHVLVGHVAPAIARFAEEHGFDLVLMGTHGRNALTHLLLGSVSSDVVRLCPVPVVLVK